MSVSAARFGTELVVEPTVAGTDADAAAVEASQPARLVVVRGSSAGSAIVLGGDETSVGRAPYNDVVLPDISVSRRHALLRREAKGYVLLDRDSANGTALNGRRVHAARLRNGDEIALGDAAVQFVDAGRIAARGRTPPRRRFEEPLRGAIERARATAAVVGAVLLPAAVVFGVWRAKHAEIRSPAHAPRIVDVSAGLPSPDESQTSVEAAGTRAQTASGVGDAQDYRSGVTANGAVANEQAQHRAAVAPVTLSRAAASRIRAAYAAGHLTQAIALARATPGARRLAGELEKFEASWREGLARAGERRARDAVAALERAEAADVVIGAGNGGAFSEHLRTMLAGLHAQMGTAQLGAGQLGPASAHFRAALRYDPGDQRAREGLQRIAAQVDDAYLRGYVAKDIDEDAARDAFRTVVAVVPENDPTAQKARRWLERLDGKVAED